jgi:CRP-like cAMP-binding protein
MPVFNPIGLLQNHSLFRHAHVAHLLELEKSVHKLELSKGEQLFIKGKNPEAMYIVVYGLLKLALPSNQTNDKVLELIRAGQSVGEAMLLIEQPYPFYVEALESTLMLKIPKDAVLNIIEQSPSVAKQMLIGLSERLFGFMQNVERHSLQTARERVIDYLVTSSEQQGALQFRLELKKHLLASWLNLSPETFSRILHQLSDQGLIHVRGQIIQIMQLEQLRTARVDMLSA